jgi:hypothetical protein
MKKVTGKSFLLGEAFHLCYKQRNPAKLNENKSRHLFIHLSSMIQTAEERERLNEKPESRNLFICNKVCLSSIHETIG